VDVPLRSSRFYLTRRLGGCAYGSEDQWSHQGGAKDKKQGGPGNVWFAAVADKQASCNDTIIIDVGSPLSTPYIDTHTRTSQASISPSFPLHSSAQNLSLNHAPNRNTDTHLTTSHLDSPHTSNSHYLNNLDRRSTNTGPTLQ
jgi:hypothetical protein